MPSFWVRKWRRGIYNVWLTPVIHSTINRYFLYCTSIFVAYMV